MLLLTIKEEEETQEKKRVLRILHCITTDRRIDAAHVATPTLTHNNLVQKRAPILVLHYDNKEPLVANQ